MAVVLDGNIAIDPDYCYVIRSRDLALWEGPPHTRITTQTVAGSLTLVAQLWSYVAWAVKYASSVCVIGPLPSPTLGS